MGGSLSVYVFYGQGNDVLASAVYESTSLTFDFTKIEAMKTFLRSFKGPVSMIRIRTNGGYIPQNIISGCQAIESLLDDKMNSQRGFPLVFDIVCDTQPSEAAAVGIVEYILDKNNDFDVTLKIGDTTLRRKTGENGYTKIPKNYDSFVYRRGYPFSN